jgi:nucleoside-diphosphate-sugar epimerase
MSSNTPIIVTGAGGFVGSAICRAFAAETKVVGVARKSFTHPGVQCLSADLKQGLPENPELKGAIVIHTAAIMGTTDRRELWDSNVEMTRRVTEWALAHQAKHLIFISSGGVYAYRREYHWQETDAVQPIGYYGHTKHIAEQLVLAHQALDNLPVTIFRLFFPYGPGQERGVVPFVAKAVRNGTEMTIQGPGEPHMNPVHVDDCVSAVRSVLNLGPGRRIYNLAGDRVVSFLDLVRAAELESGQKAKYRTVPNGPGDLLGCTDLLKKETGWQPRHLILAG